MSLSPKVGLKWRFFEFLGFFATLWGNGNSWKGTIRCFPMHIWNCCESSVTNIITSSIFSSSHILRFHRAKNDPSWTLSFAKNECLTLKLRFLKVPVGESLLYSAKCFQMCSSCLRQNLRVPLSVNKQMNELLKIKIKYFFFSRI